MASPWPVMRNPAQRYERSTMLMHNGIHSHRNIVSLCCNSHRMPTGTFVRDVERTDMKSFGRALGLLQLSPIQRLTALQLIEGIEIDINEAKKSVVMKFLTVVPFFKVSETYRLDGKGLTANRRRDGRKGKQYAQASLKREARPIGVNNNYINNDDGVYVLTLESHWEEPNTGRLVERIHTTEHGELVVESTLSVKNGVETTRQVYNPVDSWKPQNSWNPLMARQLIADSNSSMDWDD